MHFYPNNRKWLRLLKETWIPLLLLIFTSSVLRAQLVTQATQGDVIIAFRDTANASTGSYLVNAGPVSQFVNANPGTTTPLGQLSALSSDLSNFNTFQESSLIPWHQRSQVVWSAFARNFSDNEAVYISKARPSLATQSAPWTAITGQQQNAAYAHISTVTSQGYNVLSQTTSNLRGAFQTQLTGSESYFAQVATAGRQDFSTWSNVEKSFVNGAADAALDFYVHRKGASLFDRGTIEYLGYFTVNTNGVISFTKPSSTDPNTGPQINVLGPTLESLTSGVSVQSLGTVVLSSSSEAVVFRIRNVGQAALTGVTPQIRGVHAADFSIVQLPDETLSSITGESTLHVVFTPSAVGTRQATLEITSSDSNHSPFLINLEGVGQSPPLTITNHPASTSIAYGSSANLQVTASPQGAIDYQWYQGSAGNTATPVGTNAPSFTTPLLTQTTSYWVRIRNTAGFVDSNTAIVTVGSPPSPPTINTHPASTSVAFNSTATLQVAASGQGALSYQWYQGSSGNTTTPVGTNSSTFTTPTLTQSTSYWVQVRNTAGFVNSNSAVVNVTGLATTNYAVGNSIFSNFSSLLAPGITLKINGKLPPGIIFNAKTGILQGTLTKEGSFVAALQVLQGTVLRATLPLNMTVASFPSSLLGSYEAIVENANREPIGALTLVIGTNTWTASLRQAGQRALSARGRFVVETGRPSANITIPFVGLPPLVIPLSGNSPLINATWNDGKTLRGFKLASLAESPLVVSNVGMVFDAGESTEIDLPAGFGWAAGTVSKVGRVAFKGTMSDGTALSFSLSLSTTGQAILWAQPYKNLNSYLAGVVDLPLVGRPANTNLAINRSLRWALYAGEKANPYAFPGGVAVETRVAEIGTPPAGSVLPVLHLGPSSDKAGWPTSFTVDSRFNLVATNSDQVKWVGKVTRATGVLTGTYTLAANFSTEIVGNSARASGIFLKDPEGNASTGYGLIQIPASTPTGTVRTMGITIQNR